MTSSGVGLCLNGRAQSKSVIKTRVREVDRYERSGSPVRLSLDGGRTMEVQGPRRRQIGPDRASGSASVAPNSGQGSTGLKTNVRKIYQAR